MWCDNCSNGKGHPVTGHQGPRRIHLLILNLGARRGWVVSTTPWLLYPRERPGTIVQEAGWAPGTVWTCAKYLAPTGIRSPDRPAHRQPLYRLSYPAHDNCSIYPNIKQQCISGNTLLTAFSFQENTYKEHVLTVCINKVIPRIQMINLKKLSYYILINMAKHQADVYSW
jgi:hypothetical protein